MTIICPHCAREIELDAIADEDRAKAQALDRLTNSAGALNLTDAAKALGIAPRRFINTLIAREWVYRRRDGRLTAMQRRLESGDLAQKIYRRFRNDGTTAIEHQPLVTPAGLARLARYFAGGRR